MMDARQARVATERRYAEAHAGIEAAWLRWGDRDFQRRAADAIMRAARKGQPGFVLPIVPVFAKRITERLTNLGFEVQPAGTWCRDLGGPTWWDCFRGRTAGLLVTWPISPSAGL